MANVDVSSEDRDRLLLQGRGELRCQSRQRVRTGTATSNPSNGKRHATPRRCRLADRFRGPLSRMPFEIHVRNRRISFRRTLRDANRGRPVSDGDELLVAGHQRIITAYALRNHGRPPVGFSALMAPPVSFIMRRANRKDLARLKQLLGATENATRSRDDGHNNRMYSTSFLRALVSDPSRSSE